MELWRIMHWITGADYVHLENYAGEMIRKVRYTHTGRAYVKDFGAHLVWLDNPEGWVVTRLTASRAKA